MNQPGFDQNDASKPPGCDQTRQLSDPPRLRQVFDAFDANHDGLLTMHELSAAMQKLGLQSTADSLLRMVDDCDCDKDECLNFGEFLALNQMLENESGDGSSDHPIDSKTREERDLKEVFQIFDKDGNGQISPEELKFTLCDLGFLAEGTTLSRIYSMIRKVDTDGDGQVSFTEFQTMMKRT